MPAHIFFNKLFSNRNKNSFSSSSAFIFVEIFSTGLESFRVKQKQAPAWISEVLTYIAIYGDVVKAINLCLNVDLCQAFSLTSAVPLI